MALLARGSVTDRPWGLTFGALGVRGLSGELAVVADGKTYRVAFDGGVIVGAHSPLASDSAVKVALTANLITSTQVPDITRRMAASPGRDDVELLAEIARLQPDHAHRLRRRLVANRAARAFSIERGDFTVEDTFTLPIYPGCELDIRTACYLGAKNNLSEERMGAELDALGGRFQLKPDAVEDLPQFGFTEAEKPALQMLLQGADLVEIEDAVPALGARGARAVVYALVSCAACEIGQATRGRAAPAPAGRVVQPAMARAPGPPGQPPPAARPPGQPAPAVRPAQPASASQSGIPRPQGAQPGSGAVRVPAAPTGTGRTGMPRAPSSGGQDDSGPAVRMRSPTGQPPMQMQALPEQRPNKPSKPPPVRRAKRNSTAALEVEALLQSKVPLLDQRADHYALFGLTSKATNDEIKKVYFDLARKLHPDRLSAIGVVDEARNAQRLMAQINAAFAVLNDATKRAQYSNMLLRGGEAAIQAQDAQADEMATKIFRAEEAFRQGEMALRRDALPQAVASFQEAASLQPNEADYQAMLAWAQFAAAPDKNAAGNNARKALTKAAELNRNSPTARFFLGRVERMLGKEKEALGHFQEVLRIKPNHSEAASEARVLESRLKGKR